MRSLFQNTHSIVVVGCSSNTTRTSYHIANYIQQAGYRMIPVNPNETEILGETCYASIRDLPSETAVDIVNIFRNKAYTASMVEEVIEWSKRAGQDPVIWTQLNVSTPEAEELAKQAGLRYVKNRCLMVEHQALYSP